MSRERPVIAVRPPPRPVDLEAFVSGGSGQPLAASNPAVNDQTPAASGRRRRGIVARASGIERARVTVYLDPAVAERLRRHAFETGSELSELAADAIARMVAALG
jgi:hypothetical protein